MKRRLVIEGAPRTKKNSQRILRRGRKRFVAPSKAFEAWEADAIPQLQRQVRRLALLPSCDVPVNMRAMVYRERAGRADLLNYLAAVSDALEAAHILVDDKLVAAVDGSRLLIDRKRPRVEIELTPFQAGTVVPPTRRVNAVGSGT